MKQIIFSLIGAFFLFVMEACQTGKKDIAGNWMAPIDGMEIFNGGFVLQPDGSAKSINMSTLVYKNWKQQGDLLLLSGESMGSQILPITDTFRISEEGSQTVLRAVSGKQFAAVDSLQLVRMVNEYETMYCYSVSGGKDFADLRFMRAGDAVMGSLTYKLDGKDANMGNFTGKIKGDTLDVLYSFFSEDVKSVRQVVFLRNGEGWAEGYGDIMTDSTDAVYFKNPSSLTFTGGLQFQKVSCQ